MTCFQKEGEDIFPRKSKQVHSLHYLRPPDGYRVQTAKHLNENSIQSVGRDWIFIK
jgi:hypothetical protein